MIRNQAHLGAAIFAVSLSLGATACISKSDYDAALADASKAKAQNVDLEKQLAAAKADAANKPAEKPADLDAETKAKLEELKRQKAAAEARLQTYEALAAKFKKLIDSGKLELDVRHGQIVLALDTDVLFDPGKTELKPDGQTALKEVADAIRTVNGRRFQVAGHTDASPIKTKEFPSNWELSTARAVVVVKLLIKEGVKSTALSAAGYAEHDPVGNNVSNQGRAKNRRIEIVLVPNLDEILGIDELTKKGKSGAAPAPQTGKPKK